MFIAIDMGTSNTRLWLCEEDNIIHFIKASIGAGITKSKGKAFLFAEIKKLIEGLMRDANISADAVECIMVAGMAGSELGLIEVPRIPLPIDAYTLANHLQTHILPEISSIPFIFIPGIKKCNDNNIQDVIRGEETETTGIINALSLAEDCVLVLPGTHNKILSLSKDGTITDFYTTMSGELLHTIIENSILAGTVGHEFIPNESYVLRGAAYAKENGINTALFQIRIMWLNGVSSDKLSSFLYGCVLGQDVEKILLAAKGKRIFIGGNKALKQIYTILLSSNAHLISDDLSASSTRIGLCMIYKLYKRLENRSNIIHTIAHEKLIAIIRNPDKETLLPAVKALYNGGVRMVEVTFDRSGNTPKEETARLIQYIKENTSLLVGAGTVTTKEELELAAKAGASYIISPNCDDDIVKETRRLGLVSIPAAYTPTEIAAAIKAGADYVKVFPADDLPRGYIKALKAPLSDARLLAVGGITQTNAKDFLADGFDGIGVGSNLYCKKLIAAKDFKALENLAREYVSAVKKA
ncbi:MAG: 2-dehydro-3-deoxygalactonokinase [Clostridia bacterium]|nr:2-dehydro-3-deoxygalactonokinase [Clostridia bacterium]